VQMRDLEIRVFWFVAAVLLVLRVIVGAGDFGGIFMQVTLSAAGVKLLPLALKKYGEKARPLIRFVLLPLAFFALALNLFFAPQVVFPFVAAIALLGVGIPLWVEDKTAYAIVVVVLSLPVLAWCAYGVRHIAQVVQLRTLDPADVAYIRLAANNGAFAVALNDRAAIASICAALRDLKPYSPNHERRSQKMPWDAEIVFRNGGRRKLVLIAGTRADPETVWIEMGAPSYHSKTLYRVLEAVKVQVPVARTAP
jgi:hypothetical protein